MSVDDVTPGPDPTRESLLETAPERLRDLVYGSMSAEFASVRDGKPVTYPLTPFYDERRGLVIVSSPIAYAGKLRNVAADPHVSILLHDADGEYLLCGDARIRDGEPEAHAAYVRELTEREPDTPKRTANLEKFDFAASRLGSHLVGWIGERVVVEIDPVSLVRVADPTPLEVASSVRDVGMADAEARRYERAVLTLVGEDGYPASVPIGHVRATGDGVALEPTPDPTPADGQPACLLLHWHDEASIYLGQRVIRGRFRVRDGATTYVPASSSTLRNEGYLDAVRFVVDGIRRTRAARSEAERTRTAAAADGVPPGPRGLPVVGNTAQFLRNPIRFYESLPAYGDVVRYRVGWHTWTALFHPDNVERVLVRDSHRFRRYNFEELGFDVVDDGLFFTEGDRWRRQRRVIQPAFAPGSIAPYRDPIVARTAETVDGWADGETIVATHEFSELVLEILASTLFDLDLDHRHDVVTDAGRALADRVDTRRLSTFLPSRIPTARNRRFDRRMDRFADLVDDLIDERRTGGTDREDLLSTLLAMSESRSDSTDDRTVAEASDASEREDDAGFTDAELRDQLVTFLFAGHETTALVLTYAALVLARDAEVRDALEAELAAVCDDRDPTIDDVPALEYTDRVIRETMRRYPPVYVLFREALEDVTIDGYQIPAGTKVALPQYVLHADERWWEDPRSFDPDRWISDDAGEPPEYAYFPFGGGPRHCVGMRLATMILTLGLATIVRRVRFELESDPEPDLRMAATLAPDSDVVLRVHRRG